MVLPEEPEPPEDCYKVRKEWFSRKVKMYVVRIRENDQFVTAMQNRPLALDWVDRHNQKRNRRQRE